MRHAHYTTAQTVPQAATSAASGTSATDLIYCRTGSSENL